MFLEDTFKGGKAIYLIIIRTRAYMRIHISCFTNPSPYSPFRWNRDFLHGNKLQVKGVKGLEKMLYV